MTQITHGHVKYSRMVRPADFENKVAEVEIHFAISEHETDVAVARRLIDDAGQIAISKSHELLALPAPKAAVAQVSTTAAPHKIIEGAQAAVAHAGKTKEQLAAEAKAPAPATEPAKTRAKKPPKDADPADMGEHDPTAGAGAQAAQPAKGDPADMGDENLFGAEAAPAKKITDEELTSAITRRNGVIKNPVAIRQLIGTFVAPPGQARDIPQEKRQEFLDKLAALPAPAAA